MNCNGCGAVIRAPGPRREPQLQCSRCGARQFAWLGDHFGARETVAARPRTGGTGVGMILLLVCAFVMLFSCVCLAALINGV